MDAVWLFGRDEQSAKRVLTKNIESSLLQTTRGRRTHARSRAFSEDDLGSAAGDVFASAERFLEEEKNILDSLSSRLGEKEREQLDDAWCKAQHLAPLKPIEHRKAMCRLVSMAASREAHKVLLGNLKRGRVRLAHALEQEPALEDLLRLGLSLIGIEIPDRCKLIPYFAIHPEHLRESIDAYLRSSWCITELGPKDRSHWVAYVAALAKIYTNLTGQRLSHAAALPSSKAGEAGRSEGPGVTFVRRCIEPLWPAISIGQVQHLIRAANKRIEGA